MLSEDVAAAVVLPEAEAPSRSAVKSWPGDFKVTPRILFLAQIPVGATGKPQRIGLAEQRGLARAR